MPATIELIKSIARGQKMQHAVKGLETELDRLTSRLVNAMANRDSLEEVLVIVFVIFLILSNALFQLPFS